ncbi:peptide/nickel transport system ATP-binding protein [Bhargavaea beijingensis]|uniref:Peptide/nickel transport system ATP-binding protein n=1 Tax=Bhargavaea beijingensis TaxID=426756 RepID=A0A1G6ZUY7_9BACL|nr:ABC transporter ATP-binding protein [Bhargavaea beijingensis]SDE06330.1 peptide/nickel transport system ATP-binding protein [Bhargavaea beijingensis]
MAILEFDHLTVAGEREEILSGLTFSLPEGETAVMIGQSGSGKSMTARAALGMLPDGLRASGAVRFRGESVFHMPDKRRRTYLGRGAGIVFQDSSGTFDPIRSIGQHFRELFSVHFGLTGKDADMRALQWISRAGIPDPARAAAAYPHELSGGMRQRIQIALAASLEPELLIADEPTTALDLNIQTAVLELLKDWKKETGGTLLLITHDLGVAREMADRVLVMDSGKLAEERAAHELFAAPRSRAARQLAEDWRTVGEIPTAGKTDTSLPLLNVSGLSRSYRTGRLFKKKEVRALDEASLSIGSGEIVGLIGESGGGKSTLARLLAGIEPAQTGTITWKGNGNWPEAVQWVHQDPASSFNPDWTAGRLVTEGLEYRGVKRTEREQVARSLLAEVGLSPETVLQYPVELSGGMNQRLALARALAVSAELVILDEPFASLDMSAQARMIRLIRSLRDREGVAFLFITHDIRTAFALCDNIYVIRQGRIIDGGTPDELASSAHPYSRSLLAHVPGRGDSPIQL